MPRTQVSAIQSAIHSKPLEIGPRHSVFFFFKASQLFPTGNQGGESMALAEILKSVFNNK